jgi:dTDP-glucose 4,6-dehydratase
LRNLLVTGGAGFIGSNFIRFALAADPEVHITNLDKLTYAGLLENLDGLPAAPKHRWVQGDICDQSLVASLLREAEIDTIVNFAAESHVDRSIDDPAVFIQTNVLGTLSLLQAARQVWLDEGALPIDAVRFHHISTDEVYGSLSPDDPPFKEETAYAPNSPYAASKASSDHLVRSFAHTYGLPVTISNCSNNYGPRQFPEKFIPLTISNAQEGLPIPVYGDGGNIRDWLYVEDHCTALWKILEQGRPDETYNIGGGNQPTNIEIVKHACDILDELLPGSPHRPHSSLITFVPDRPGHDRRYAIDSSKIRAELGWEPQASMESGLRNTIQWYLDNHDWTVAAKRSPGYDEWIARNYESRGRDR